MGRRRVGILLMVLLLAFGGSAARVWAAAIPEQQGLVTDTAGLYSEEERVKIEGAAKGDSYTFYVLTVESLEGVEANEYAQGVYRSWGLSRNDILLLISLGNRRVEMNFNNPTLLTELDQRFGRGNGSISELTTEYFNPSAKQGDYAGATLAVIGEVHRIAEASSVEPGGNGAPERTSKPDTAVVPAPETTSNPDSVVAPVPERTARPADSTPFPGYTVRAAEESHSPLLPLLLLAGGAAFIAALVWIGYGLLLKRRMKRQVEEARELLIGVSRSGEKLKPFLGLVQGSTEQLVTRLDRELSALAVEASAFGSELAEASVSLFKLGELNRRLLEGSARLLELNSRFRSVEKEVAGLIEVDKTVKGEVKQLQERLDSAAARVEELKARHGYPLGHLADELAHIAADIAKAADLSIFDPLEAAKLANRTENELASKEKDAEDFPVLLEAHRSFPDRAAGARSEVDTLIRENGLKLPHTDPFGTLSRAANQVAPLIAALQAGQVEAARTISGEMDHLLAEAVEMTKRQAYLKGKNAADIRIAEERISRIHAEEGSRRSERARVTAAYARIHWTPLEEGYERAERLAAETERTLPDIRVLTDEEHQEYDKARSLLDEGLARLDECERLLADNVRAGAELDRLLAQSKERLAEYGAVYERGIRRIKAEDLRFHSGYGADQVGERIEALRNRLGGLLANAPYELNEIGQLLDQLQAETGHYTDMVQEVALQKENAERQLLDLERRYRAANGRMGSSRYAGLSSNDYSSRMGDIASLLAAGYYARALEESSGLESAIHQIELAIEEARREEEERQSAASSISANDSSWNSSSFDSNSSGGSSWDSGSSSGSDNSSGGSNW
ncbi:septation ring formation regulator EzrA [Gorillibacterium timonense]|uniref:septation ring formation regulator EzrA n=1 Tax=Gorillibacterium timonense TaxID=1689269 RepID=UPI00071DE89F|nr:septation ring formation regulator EzrA [Gorillibacterium timonense]